MSEEDFTLRTVESLEVDAMLDKFSPIKGRNQTQNKMVVTSTPRKKKVKKEKKGEVDAIFLELSGENESVPQLYPTHYFNILNIFGVGCSNYKVRKVSESQQKYMKTNSTQNTTKSYHEDSTIGIEEEELTEFDVSRSFDRSVINNQDFPLSSSFSNMYKKNGLHIEEGRVGR